MCVIFVAANSIQQFSRADLTSKTPETVTSKEQNSKASQMDAASRTDICTTPVAVHQRNDTIAEEDGDVAVAVVDINSPDNLISLDEQIVLPVTTGTPPTVKYRTRDTFFGTPTATKQQIEANTVTDVPATLSDELIHIHESPASTSEIVMSKIRVSSVYKAAFVSPVDSSPVTSSPAVLLQSQTSNCSVVTISSDGSEIPCREICADDNNQSFEMTLSSLNEDELDDMLPTSPNDSLMDSDIEDGELRGWGKYLI